MAQNLKDVFTCYICLEDFPDDGDHTPRILPCIHTLCEGCFVVSRGCKEGAQLACPVEFSRNTQVVNVVNFVLLRSEELINSEKFSPVGLEHQHLRIFIQMPIHMS